MRIAIMSDSHDNIVNLTKALKFINKENIKILIHCGDLCAPSILTEVLVPNFKGKMHLVHGNVGDPELLERIAKRYKDITIHGYEGKINIDGKKIAFTHFRDASKRLAESGKYDIVFYGHTHKPWLCQAQTVADNTQTHAEKDQRQSASSRRRSAVLVNPGTVGGMFYKATFAIYDTKTNKLELKILERI